MASKEPFLKWAGGKRQLLPELQKALPSPTSFHRYVEPFVGGGAMFFYLSDRGDISEFVLSDINPDLMACYQVVRDRVEDLINKLAEIESKYYESSDRKQFYQQKRDRFNRTCRSKGGEPNLERVALLIFLNRVCYNGLYRVNKKGDFNVPFGRYKAPKICMMQTLQEASRSLQKVQLQVGEYREMVSYARTGTFFYLDPPYLPTNKTSNFTSYYNNKFNYSEHEHLAYFCQSIDKAGAYFMLTNADTGDGTIESLYEGFKVTRVRARRSINSNKNKRGSVTEVIVTNYL